MDSDIKLRNDGTILVEGKTSISDDLAIEGQAIINGDVVATKKVTIGHGGTLLIDLGVRLVAPSHLDLTQRALQALKRPEIATITVSPSGGSGALRVGERRIEDPHVVEIRHDMVDVLQTIVSLQQSILELQDQVKELQNNGN